MLKKGEPTPPGECPWCGATASKYINGVLFCAAGPKHEKDVCQESYRAQNAKGDGAMSVVDIHGQNMWFSKFYQDHTRANLACNDLEDLVLAGKVSRGQRVELSIDGRTCYATWHPQDAVPAKDRAYQSSYTPTPSATAAELAREDERRYNARQRLQDYQDLGHSDVHGSMNHGDFSRRRR